MVLNLEGELSMAPRLVSARVAEIDVALFRVSREGRVRAVAGRRALLMPASTVAVAISVRLLRRVERQHAVLETV